VESALQIGEHRPQIVRRSAVEWASHRRSVGLVSVTAEN
jgi:hypothetical protein